MKSIAFYNNKGGVGKTTSVINIAYELSGENSVLVIDVDGQANCSRFFTEELKEGLDKALVNTEVSPETALCHTRYDNIDIITATPKLNGITSEFDSFTDEEQAAIARNILSFGSAYDYVLLDLPPALTKVTERLIGACDVVFIPIELGIFSIQGVPTVTGIVKKCGAKFGGCILLFGEDFTESFPQLVQSLYAVKPFSCFRYLGHYVVFTEIHLSVNLGKGEIPHICRSRDNSCLFVTLFGMLADSVCEFQITDSLFKLFRKHSSLNRHTGGFVCISVKRKLHTLFHFTEYHFRVVDEIVVYGNALAVSAYIAPIGHFHSHFLTLLEEQNIRCNLRASVRLKCVVRQTDSAD